MESINVEKIMQEIREDIARKGYKEEDLSFQDIPIKEQGTMPIDEFNIDMLERTLHNANMNTGVDYYRPFEGNALKRFVKKLVRKIMKPVVYHLFVSQESYNSNTIQTVNQMYLYIQKLEARITDLERMISDKEK